MEALGAALPGLMFAALVAGLFSTLPVPVVLCGVTLVFGLVAVAMGEMRVVQVSLLPNRIFGGIIENPVLVAAPMFIFMGVVMEKTRIAEDLLIALQRALRAVPGGLALAVTIMGTILAAATGIVGASVVMLTVLAVPTMLDRGYSPALAAGTVASAGTLGILIPPSVMLVFMGDLLTLNLAKLFVAAFLPGLALAATYLVFLVLRAALRPGDAPAAPAPEEGRGLWRELLVALLLPSLIIVAVLGSILGGIATPTEASGVGAFSALLLGLLRGRLSLPVLGEAMDGSVRTLAMLFFIFVGATAFSYVFRQVGGEDFIVGTARALDLGRLGAPGHHDGHGVRDGLLLRLDRDHPDPPAHLRAHRGAPGPRRPRGARRHDLLVRRARGREPPDLVPHPALRLRAVLPQGRGGRPALHGRHLPRHRALRGAPAPRAGAADLAARHRHLAAGEAAGLSRLGGKRAAVFGAGSIGPGWGNGKAAAVLFARHGARVLCVDREGAAARETVGIIVDEGGEAAAHAADVTDEAACEGAVAAAEAAFGGLDAVLYNVGISLRGGVADTEPADWDRVMDANLRGAFLVARAALPGMRARGSGAFVFVSSIAAVWSAPYAYASYEVSKAGLCRLSASIARAHAGEGIRSNAILPGPIDTPHVAAYVASGADPAALAAQRAAMVPMGRQGTAWDVAHAALYLASDEAGFVTGVDLRVDGGTAL